jgi:hypothetical protein
MCHAQKIEEQFYNEEDDTLYIFFDKPKPTIVEDLSDGVVAGADPETGEIIVLMFHNLSQRFMPAEKRPSLDSLSAILRQLEG